MEVTVPGKGYASPTLAEIEKVAQHFGLPIYHPTLMRDVANLISGGTINSKFVVDPADEKLAFYANIISELSNNALIQNPDQIPGISPLVKAANYIYSQGGAAAGQAAAAAAGAGAPQNKPAQQDKGDNGGNDDNKKEGLDNPPEGADPNFGAEEAYEKIENLIDANEIMKRISFLLDRTPAFELSKNKRLIPDAYGTTIRTRGIEEIGEIAKLRQEEFGHIFSPYGLSRIFTGEAQIREWCKEEIPKKRYYLMVDASGSMCESNKITKALGVLYTLMQRVLKLDVVVDFAFFATRTLGFQEIADPASVDRIVTYANSCKWDGGGTNIIESIHCVFKHMDENKKNLKQELAVKDIVIITDGEDSATRNLEAMLFRTKHARLHYIEVSGGDVGQAVHNHNPTLRRIAAETGGFSATY